MSKYQPSKKMLDISKVYQHGKTHIPCEVRKVLGIKDGARLIWTLDNGKIVVEIA
jgi:bifunctional DNA-binding transcriptional regulator/antitoxin component of YhaV-PrlF toxin-antitoxin module